MRRKSWTKLERQILKDNYNIISLYNLLELLPGRTETSITSQVYFLRKRGWTFGKNKERIYG